MGFFRNIIGILGLLWAFVGTPSVAYAIECDGYQVDGYCYDSEQQYCTSADRYWINNTCTDVNPCNNHGDWSNDSGICTCNSGYTGNYCEKTLQQACTNQGLEYEWNSDKNKCVYSCPVGYSTLTDNATSINDCYHECTTDDVENSSAVSGGYYYGNAAQCTVTACKQGWHLVDVISTIDKTAGTDGGYTDNNGVFAEYTGNNKGADYYGITDNRTFAVSYGDRGFLYGRGHCSSRSGVGMWNGASSSAAVSTVTDISELPSNGSQCWCSITQYKEASGQTHQLSSLWVYRNIVKQPNECDSVCARYCLYGMQNTDSSSLGFRQALFEAMDNTVSSAKCAGNTIKINWPVADIDDVNATNAGTAIYGGDIRTPLRAKNKPGKVFKGWKFKKTSGE